MVSNRKQILILFALVLFLGYISFAIFIPNLPSRMPFSRWFGSFKVNLGLDLQGGAHLLYQADTSQVTKEDAESAIAGVRDVIERRVNALGVSEPLVQTSVVGEDFRIIVELAGVFDINEAIKQIGETPLLEFKTETIPPSPEPISEEEKSQRESFNQIQLERANEALAGILAFGGENFAEVATEQSEDVGSSADGGDLGFVSRGMFIEEFEKVLFDDLKDGEIATYPVETEFGYHLIQRMESRVAKSEFTGEVEEEVRGRHVFFRKQSLEGDIPYYEEWTDTGLGGAQLKKSEVQFDQYSGFPHVALIFNDEGDKLFEEITDKNVGKRIAIFLDGMIISAPVVQQKISGGTAIITGNFTIPEARELVERLNAGALPIPINLVSQQTVGPSLGRVSIEKSVTAGLIGFILVALFMIFVYRLSGLLSVFALMIYAGIVFSLFKLIPVTLTLAGIAGFLLSIGIAVDANVLIFERLKEELKKGEPFGTAISEAFERAWNSIRDSNFSTLITCLILAWFGTSMIKGFAITLGIGVLVSMFSAIVVTRVFVELVSLNAWARGKKWIWGG